MHFKIRDDCRLCLRDRRRAYHVMEIPSRIKFVQMVINVVAEHYREVFRKIFIVNAPLVFPARAIYAVEKVDRRACLISRVAAIVISLD